MASEDLSEKKKKKEDLGNGVWLQVELENSILAASCSVAVDMEYEQVMGTERQ